MTQSSLSSFFHEAIREILDQYPEIGDQVDLQTRNWKVFFNRAEAMKE